MTANQMAARGHPSWPKDVLRISFGIIWAIDAGLKWAPGFRAGYMDTIMGARDRGHYPWRWEKGRLETAARQRRRVRRR